MKKKAQDKPVAEKQPFRFVLFAVLAPLALPLFFFIVALARKRPVPPAPLLFSWLSGVFVFLFAYILYRLLHYGLWVGVSGEYRNRFIHKRGDDEEPAVPLSLFSLKGEQILVGELNGDHAGYAESLEKKFGRASVCWQYPRGLLFPLGCPDEVLEEIKSRYKTGKDKSRTVDAGLLFLYFRWMKDGASDIGEEFRRYSDFLNRVNDAVHPYHGVVFHVTASMAAVVFSGNWSTKETAVRTLKAAKETAALFSSGEVPAGGGFVVADYLPAVEWTLSSARILRYFLESPGVSRYLGVSPAFPDNPLTLSGRLVNAVKSGEAV